MDDLRRQSEMSIEDLLKSLPEEVLEKPANIVVPSNVTDDSDFSVNSDFESDVGETLDEQEKHEKSEDHSTEINTLKVESEMSIEELRKMYGVPTMTVTSTKLAESSESSSDSSEESEGEDLGMVSLVADEDKVLLDQKSEAGPEGINDIAATAMSLQPTGYTLETTQVSTFGYTYLGTY